MISRYRDAGARKGYLIFALTDETYALLQLWKRNELVSIFGATALYMLLVQVVFP